MGEGGEKKEKRSKELGDEGIYGDLEIKKRSFEF